MEAYLEQTVVANPHLGLTYRPPKGADPVVYPRVTDELPREAQEIKPHPHGVELGMLLNMLQDSSGQTVKEVLMADFSRVTQSVAEHICRIAKVNPKADATTVMGDDVERLYKALGEVKLMAPPASCIVPIGEDAAHRRAQARASKDDFYVSSTRPPAVYRGNPFVVEVGLAYGGNLPVDEPAEIMRFANRVPLQYQPKACAISEAMYDRTGATTSCRSRRAACPSARSPSSSTSRACGCRSRARPRRRSRTTTICSAR